MCECKTKAMNKVSFHAPVSDRIRTAGFVLVALVYVISGFRAVNWRADLADERFETRFQSQARALAAAMDPDDVRAFTGPEPTLKIRRIYRRTKTGCLL